MRLAFLLLLAGCAPLAVVLDPPLAQLARWEGASPADIAAEPVACPAGHPACARLHMRRAEACMGLAMASRAPGAACPGAAGHLPCAAEGYAAARALAPSPALAAGEAQARLCLAELLPPAAAAAELARAAPAIAASPASRAPLLSARAALIAARPGAGTDAQRCAATRAGLAVAPPASREARDLALRRATLPACGATP
jgi:DNA polymerase-3 subunit gamma/tau